MTSSVRYYLFLPLLFFSFWDYYVVNLHGRIFDYIGVSLVAVICFIFACYGNRVGAVYKHTIYLLQLLYLIPFLLLGAYNGNWLSAAAYTLGYVLTFIVFFQYARSISSDTLEKQLNIIIVIHLIFFWVQYFSFYLHGSVLDFHSALGSIEPRVYNPGNGYFRAAGLFQEPNSYCLAMFLLNMLRLSLHRTDGVMLLSSSVLSMILSQSLWGFGAVLVLSGFAALVYRPIRINWVIKYIASVMIGSAVIVALTGAQWRSAMIPDTTVTRIESIQDDPSFAARYKLSVDDATEHNRFLGNGINTKEFQAYLGANAIGFYLYSFGIVGFIIYCVWLYTLMSYNRILFISVIFFVMTSYPLFTYQFWWAWLGMLLAIAGKSAKMSRDGLCVDRA